MENPLTYHLRFTPDELNKQYNLRAVRLDVDITVINRWVSESKSARESLNCEVDIRYGEGCKQKLDIFHCGDSSASTLVYFHGGYWQGGDKSIYSFMASTLNKASVNFIVVGYDLCPEVTVTHISDEAREAIIYVWRNAKNYKINQQRITVMGHSAGGHIAQMMMATCWPEFGCDLPKDLVKAAILISPISYLEPVRLTSALNANLRMSKAEAKSQSPLTNHPPITNAPQLIFVGSTETSEFKRQAKIYLDAYSTKERKIELLVVPGVDHFDILKVLMDPSSSFFKKIIFICSKPHVQTI